MNITRSQLLLLLITSKQAGIRDGTQPLDRLRMQKAVFFLTLRGPGRWRDLYLYQPYDWGPYSSRLTSDIKALSEVGLLRQGEGRYGRHHLTAEGQTLADAAWPRLSESEQRFFISVRSYVTSRSFADLLREVYAAYPEFATESRFQPR